MTKPSFLFPLILLLSFLPVPDTFARGATGVHPRTYCATCARDSHGRIQRSSSEREKFLKSQGLTHTPPGHQVDHIKPLSKGGADKTWNMQLIPKNSPKEKNELK